MLTQDKKDGHFDHLFKMNLLDANSNAHLNHITNRQKFQFILKDLSLFLYLHRKEEMNMSFDGAVIKEQGVTFAIVVVKPYVLYSINKEEIRANFVPFFGNIPIILMAQNSRGVPTYDGRRDIVNFLAKIHPARIPWKHYTAA